MKNDHCHRLSQFRCRVKDTVYRWRERKGLPAHKIGRLWQFHLSEVDKWVRAGGADEEKRSDSPMPSSKN